MTRVTYWGLLLSILLVEPAFSQAIPSTTTIAPSTAADPEVQVCAPGAAPKLVDTTGAGVTAVCTITKETLKPLQPTFLGSLARAFQYKYEIGEQQPLLFVNNSIVNNPEHYINQHSLKFDFAELFTSASDLDDLVQKIAEDPANSKTKTQVKLGLCGKKVIECLADGGGMWKRAVSGLSITAALAERPALQQGVVQPEPPFFGHYGVAGQIDFNPANLFINGANWKKAITAAQRLSIDDGEIARMEKQVGAKQSISSELFEAFVPTFQFKRTSEFDFVKNGGVLIPAPFLESALNSYTFTWDLKRAIPSTSMRVAAADAASKIASYQDPLKRDEADAPDTAKSKNGTKLCIIYSGSLRSSISVSKDFEAGACQTFARDVGADHYALACVTTNRVVIGIQNERESNPNQDSKAGLPCWL